MAGAVMASGFRDFTTVFATRMVVLLTSLATQSCLAWVLGPADRGSYAVCLLFATLLSLFCMVGCEYACLYYVASKKFSVSEAVVQALVYGGTGAIVAIGVGVAMMQFPLGFLQKASPGDFRLALVGIPLGFFAYLTLELLTALKEFGWYAVIMVAVNVVQLLLALLYVWFLDWGVRGALLANLTSQAITIAAAVTYLRARHGLTWVRPSLEKLKAVFGYGTRYYVGKISNEVNFQVGTVILALFASREDIGVFSVAALLAARVMIIPDVLMVVLLPRVADDRTGRAELVAQCTRVTTAACGLVLVVLVIFAHPIVAVLFSPAFLPMVPLIWILSIGVLFRCASKIFTQFLLGTNHPGVQSVSAVVAMVTNLAVLAALMPALGLVGAALGMTVGYIAGSLVLAYNFNRLSGLGYGETWRARRADWTMVRDGVRRLLGRMAPTSADTRP
jgi:O-antigen/teichoic acid export membrane protein